LGTPMHCARKAGRRDVYYAPYHGVLEKAIFSVFPAASLARIRAA
jgi:hypothetical protein